MFINETLAKGMKDRFFQDFQAEISEPFAKTMKSMTLRNTKRGKWIHAARIYVDRLEPFLIASYEGGSRVKPYFVTTTLAILDSREYNTWDEKCLFSFQGLLSFDPAFVDVRWGYFNIGEHAIMRLFMRSPIQEDERGTLKPYSIIKQLLYVPLWSTFWTWFHGMTADIDFRDDLSIPIPAPDGLFFGRLSKEERAVEIRTFINTKSASQDAKTVRDLMIQISEPLLHSPLSASPVVNETDVDHGSAILAPILCRKLTSHSDVLARLSFKRTDGDQPHRNSPQVFSEQLSRLAAISDPYWEIFENAPLREFLVQANHFLRRARGAKNASGTS
jgi:hypothetical protein